MTAVVVWLTDGQVLLTRPAWVDEVHTLLMARSRTPWEVVSHLAAGADYGPPLFFLLAAALGSLTGGLSHETARLFSLACMLATWLLLYATLRRRFEPAPSAIAAVTVGSHPLVVAHSFEGRFYALWLLTTVLFAWALRGTESRHRAGLAVAAVLLVTTHWYGIVVLGLMAGGAVAAHGRRWHDAARLLWPAAAGPVVLALCAPLALGQRRALTLATWVPDFRWGQVAALLQGFWLTPVLVAALGVGLAAALFRLRAAGTERFPPGPGSEPAIGALLSLAAMPLALAALSLAGQPSMLGRYALPTVLAWAPLAAWALTLAGRWPTRLFAALVAWAWFASYTRVAGEKREFAASVARATASAQAARERRLPVVFQSMHTLYAVAWQDSGMARYGRFLTLSEGELDAIAPPDGRFYQLNKGFRVERDVVSIHARRFGFPLVATSAWTFAAGPFALMISDATAPRGSDRQSLARRLFPRHGIEPAGPELLMLEPRAGPGAVSGSGVTP
jgi:hypothetical protein